MLWFAKSDSFWITPPFFHCSLFAVRRELASDYHVDSTVFSLTNRLSPTALVVSFRSGCDDSPVSSFCPLPILFEPTFFLDS